MTQRPINAHVSLALAAASAGSNADAALMVGRQCKLQNYKKKKVPSFRFSSEMIAYVSPESTFAVTRRLFDDARKSILIGIYDFTAAHVKELVLNAMSRGVRVSLMLDIDSAPERRLFEDLKRHGVEAVPAPSCAGDVHFFASSHEKVIVIDDLWTMVRQLLEQQLSLQCKRRRRSEPFRPWQPRHRTGYQVGRNSALLHEHSAQRHEARTNGCRARCSRGKSGDNPGDCRSELGPAETFRQQTVSAILAH
jgi:hypothetical protein